jgi:LmbE family N-acetylglucosaminyl deacetylase
MNIVVYVSHVDDEILGTGGLIARMVNAGHDVDIVYATDATSPRSDDIDKRSYAVAGAEHLGLSAESLHYLGFTEMRFDEVPLLEMNRRFEELDLDPDVILTNSKHDVNQDHDKVFESALVVGRSIEKQVGLLTCEIISSAEWNDVPFDPNFYVDISDTIDQKVAAMNEIKPEIREWPHPRSPEGIRVKAKQRGMEVGYQYAEAYHVIRWFDFHQSLTG